MREETASDPGLQPLSVTQENSKALWDSSKEGSHQKGGTISVMTGSSRTWVQNLGTLVMTKAPSPIVAGFIHQVQERKHATWQAALLSQVLEGYCLEGSL